MVTWALTGQMTKCDGNVADAIQKQIIKEAYYVTGLADAGRDFMRLLR